VLACGPPVPPLCGVVRPGRAGYRYGGIRRLRTDSSKTGGLQGRWRAVADTPSVRHMVSDYTTHNHPHIQALTGGRGDDHGDLSPNRDTCAAQDNPKPQNCPLMKHGWRATAHSRFFHCESTPHRAIFRCAHQRTGRAQGEPAGESGTGRLRSLSITWGTPEERGLEEWRRTPL